MREKNKILFPILLTACLLFFTLGFVLLQPSLKKAVRGEVAWNTVQSETFDYGTFGWDGGSYSSVTVDTTAQKTGAGCMRIDKNTTARASKRYSKTKDLLVEGVEYRLSFSAKSDVSGGLQTVIQFNYAEGDYYSIYLSTSSVTVGTSYEEYVSSFKLVMENGRAKVSFVRPNGQSATTTDTEHSGKTEIVSADLIIFCTSSNSLYIDDFSIKAETVAESYSEVFYSDDFTYGQIDSSSKNENRYHELNDFTATTTTFSMVAGKNSKSRSLKATIGDGTSENRFTNEGVLLTPTGNGDVHDWTVNYTVNASESSTLNVWLYFIVKDGATVKEKGLMLSLNQAVTTSDSALTAYVRFYSAGSKIYCNFQRTDMNYRATEVLNLNSSGTAVTNAEIIQTKFIFITSANSMELDNFIITENKTDLIPENSYNVVSLIDTISVSGDKSTAIENALNAYSALTYREKTFVYNYSVLASEYRKIRVNQGLYEGEFDENDIVYKIAAISDTHATKANTIKAIEVLKDWGGGTINALVHSGDIADGPEYYATWAEFEDSRDAAGVYYDYLLKDNDDIEMFFCLGNHDSCGMSLAEGYFNEFTNGTSDGSAAESRFGDRFYRTELLDLDYVKETGNRHSILGGYHFIALEPHYTQKRYQAETLRFFKETLEEITTSKDYNGEYIFVVTHVAPPNTVTQYDTLGNIMNIAKDYPQLIFLTGHSHSTLHDEYSIMQTDYTVLNMGSTSYGWFNPEFYETGSGNLLSENDPATGKSLSRSLVVGTIIEIDGKGNVRFTRVDCSNQTQIGAPYVISAPKDGNEHLLSYPQERKTLYSGNPYFESEPEISAITRDGALALTFDTATTGDSTYIESYTINLYREGESTPYATYQSLARFYTSTSNTSEKVHQVTITGLSEIPARVSIAARNFSKKYSETYYADVVNAADGWLLTVRSDYGNRVVKVTKGDKYTLPASDI